MGISRGTVKLIGSTFGAIPHRGAGITFGVQKIECDRPQLIAQLKASGIVPISSSARDGEDQQLSVHQNDLFSMLGFDSIDSIDYYSDEQPSHVLDLNDPIPAEMAGRYELVYDGGTMEHCFDPPQVLRNAATLAKVGGMVVHHVPMNNWVDHGFYQFSPTLFFDFYAACGFEELTMKIHFKGKRSESYLKHDPRFDLPIPYSARSRCQCLIFFSARKTEQSNLLLLARPIQGRYRATFGDKKLTAKRKRTFMQRLQISLRKRFFGWNAKAL